MKRRIPGAIGIMMSLIPSALLSQNLAPIAVDDTVHMCGNTITIYVQNNDTNPDGDSLTLSIYAGSINGSFSVNGNAIDYTPNVGYTGTDTLIYSLCDDGVPPLCDTAVVIIHVGADYLMNQSAGICNGDSIFLEGAWQNDDGIYTDWYTTSYGCDSIVVTTLTVYDNPLASITANGSLNFCMGDSVTLTAHGGNEFNWSTGDTSQSITVYTAGTYSVVVSDTNGCSGSASANVSVGPAPTASISPSGPITICTGDSATLTASAGVSWQWSNGETSQSITANTAGTYSVIVTDANGCTATASASVNIAPAPNATISPAGPVFICSGDAVTLTAGAGSSWQWSNGATSQAITVSNAGSYSVIVSNGSCSDTSSPVIVNVNPQPVVTISANGPLSFCAGGSVILTANGGSGFYWSTGATSQSITANSSGTYSVIATDANGCSGTASVNVNVLTAPVAAISPSGPVTICAGDSATLTASAGNSWQWSNGATSQTIVVTDPGNYSVIVSNGSCSDTSSSVSVNVTPQPAATITASGPATFCQGGSVTLTASNGSSWLWSTGVTTQTINVVSSGNYWVIVSNGNGCTATSATMAVTVNPLPVAFLTANGPTTFCEGGSVTLTSSNGSSFAWSNGETGQSIIVGDAGTYHCTVTDANGCSATSANTIVTVNSAPVAGIAADGPLDFCEGDNVTLTALNGTSWLWSNGAATQSIVVSNSGSYYVIVSDQCGNDTASAVTVTVTNSAPVAGITTTQLGYTVTFTDNSTGATSWNWNFGDNTTSGEQNPVHEYSGGGVYLVILIVSNACGSDTTSMMIELPDGTDKLGLYNAFSPNGDGFNDTWTIPMAELYSDNTVTIVNRWGNEVWKASAYDNDKVVWNGQNLNGDNLPDGSYYYIITYEGKDSRGWVFIKR
jgi:large repetitive protein